MHWNPKLHLLHHLLDFLTDIDSVLHGISMGTRDGHLFENRMQQTFSEVCCSVDDIACLASVVNFHRLFAIFPRIFLH